MKLQQLRYVVATADLGTMTAAAAATHIAQPALSRAIRALEREIGVAIFESDGRGVRVTDSGSEAVAIARRILSDIDRLSDLGAQPAVRLWATSGQARELGAPVVTGMVDDKRGSIRLTAADTRDEVFDAVRAGDADLGIAELPAPGDVQAESLGWQEFVLLCPTTWDLPPTMDVSEVSELPLLAPPAHNWRRAALEAALGLAGVRPNFVAETTERDLLPALVADGAAAAFSYGRQAQRAEAAGASLVHLRPAPVREVGVVWLGQTEPGGRVGTVVAALRDEATSVLLQSDDPRLATAARVSGPVMVFPPKSQADH